MAADIWDAQRFILSSITTHRRTAVKACHASGKTFAAALAVLWWVTRYRDGIAITSAPTWLQVEKLMWGEIHKAVGRGKLQYPKPNAVELEMAPGNYALGLSTNEADRFSGFHGMHVLIVLDEAPGVRSAIYEAIEGIRAGGRVVVLCLGNPVIASGEFFNAFGTQRETWNLKTISAFDTPNLSSLVADLPRGASDEALVERILALSEDQLDEAERPYLTSRRWVKEKWLEWGVHHNGLWDSRVMGRFPKQSTDALFTLAMLEQASWRENDKRRHVPCAGIDVAGPGEDETVLTITEGPNIMQQEWWNDPDPRGKVLAALRPWKMRDIIVKIDSAGLGHYFAAHVEDAGYRVIRINVGRKTTQPERFTNLKGQLHWALRERFEAGEVNGLTDEKTISQLSSIKYKHDARGRVIVRSKDEMRKDGLKSPDRAESLMLAYAPVGAGDDEVGFV